MYGPCTKMMMQMRNRKAGAPVVRFTLVRSICCKCRLCGAQNREQKEAQSMEWMHNTDGGGDSWNVSELESNDCCRGLSQLIR